MYASIVVYFDGTFGQHAQDWEALRSASQSVLPMPQLETIAGYARPGERGIGYSRVGVRPFTRLATRVQADGIAFAQLLEDVAEDWPGECANCTVYFTKEDRITPAAPLHASVTTNYQVSPSWPSPTERAAVQRLCETVHGTYGFVALSHDRYEALNHGAWALSSPWEYTNSGADPVRKQRFEASLNEMARRNRFRHLMGERLRGVYWGNLLPAAIVQQVGGDAAFTLAGCEVVEWINDRVLYVQLTATFATAETTAALATLARVSQLLAAFVV